jgi:hypothetical protein
MAKKNYNADLDTLIDGLKTELGENPPIQKVVPVKEEKAAKKELEGQFNIYLPKEMLEEIRQFCFDNRISKKELATAALAQYLSNHKK